MRLLFRLPARTGFRLVRSVVPRPGERGRPDRTRVRAGRFRATGTLPYAAPGCSVPPDAPRFRVDRVRPPHVRKAAPPVTALPSGRTRRNALRGTLCALVLVAGAGLAGCAGQDPDEGTNGVGKLSAGQIQQRTRAAADAARSVRLSGNVVTKGRTYKLDMRLSSQGGTGSVTSQGTTFDLLRVDKQLYLKADAAFWSRADGGKGGDPDSGAAAKLDGKYVKVPQDDPSYQRLRGFTDKEVLLGGLLTLHGTLEKDGYHEASGTRTIRITGSDGSGGTLDVSLEGTPYPLRLVRAGDAGTLTFSEWDENVSLTEPDKSRTVDYGKQLPAS